MGAQNRESHFCRRPVGPTEPLPDAERVPRCRRQAFTLINFVRHIDEHD
ncbi:MAG: hypothetical protein H6R26_1879 [Proteobacteria bacterium]|nr:hypothetical protein [Pseudomonadota bacterium]